MPSQPRPPIQHRPVCGVAMLGSKSNEGSPRVDTFSCLRCETVVTFASPPKKPQTKARFALACYRRTDSAA